MSDRPDSQRDLLFISYAWEDEFFARWLARKLALHGYGVWIDKIKILGGESWVAEVDEAIKDRSFRVLGLLSKHSIKKDNPVKERTIAQQLGRSLGIKDFLVTLNLDGTPVDWTLSDISWISFNHGWAQGLRALLKKLEAIDAPKMHLGNPAIAASSLEEGDDLVSACPEPVALNWMNFTAIPEKVRLFDYSRVDPAEWSELRWRWPFWDFRDGMAASLFDPEGRLSGITSSREMYLWKDSRHVRHVESVHLVSNILKRSLDCALIHKGCLYSHQSKAYYLPAEWNGAQSLPLTDLDGSKTVVRVGGKVKVLRAGRPPEFVLYRQGLRFRIRHAGHASFYGQLKPCVVLFDESGRQIEGPAVGSRTKRITKAWWNDKWRKRLFAFSGVVLDGLSELGIQESLGARMVQFEAPVGINESKLNGVEDVAGDDDGISEIYEENDGDEDDGE